MIISNTLQALEFLYAVALGAALGIIYILTHMTKRFQFVMDLVFCLIAVTAAIVFFLTVCGGLVRGYVLAGIVIAMLLVVCFYRAIRRRKNG